MNKERLELGKTVDFNHYDIALKAQSAGAKFQYANGTHWITAECLFEPGGIYRRLPNDKLVHSDEYSDLPPGYVLATLEDYRLASYLWTRNAIKLEFRLQGDDDTKWRLHLDYYNSEEDCLSLEVEYRVSGTEPDAKYIPFTMDTVPEGLLTLRDTGDTKVFKSAIVAATKEYLYVGPSSLDQTYSTALSRYEWLNNGEWQPLGQKVE